jgi:IS4 transposase
LQALNDKIVKNKTKLSTERGEEKIKRLKSKVRELELIKQLLDQKTIKNELSAQDLPSLSKEIKCDKSTQTEPNKEAVIELLHYK